jgi:glycosyltransferase involved in cell wall biosynthesis
MKLSVAIYSKNNADKLKRCLDRVLSVVPFEKEIIVINTHSSDEAILAQYKNRIKVVYDDSSTLAHALNMSWKVATDDVVAFLDTDTIVGEDHFQSYLTYES